MNLILLNWVYSLKYSWNMFVQGVQSWGSGTEHLICFPRMGGPRVRRMSLQVHRQKHYLNANCLVFTILICWHILDESRYRGPSRCRASYQWRQRDRTGLFCPSSSCFLLQKMLLHPMLSISLVTIPQFYSVFMFPELNHISILIDIVTWVFKATFSDS
jgi:hypothetical protein